MKRNKRTKERTNNCANQRFDERETERTKEGRAGRMGGTEKGKERS